jgi:hypothetical protein
MSEDNEIKLFDVKFIEETCHSYHVSATTKEIAEKIASEKYYDDTDNMAIKRISSKPEANDLISSDEIKVVKCHTNLKQIN